MHDIMHKYLAALLEALKTGAYRAGSQNETLDIGPINISLDCDHKWKTYVGFTQRYDYCERCDRKKHE